MTNREAIARKFHDTYERLAPQFGYATREDTKEFDPTTPNGQLMMAVCGDIGEEIEARAFAAGFQRGLAEGKPGMRPSDYVPNGDEWVKG